MGEKVKNEAGRFVNRVKEDPTSLTTFGVSVGGDTLGIKGLARRSTKALADVSGLTAQQEALEAEQEAARVENEQAIDLAEKGRKQDIANTAASRGAKVRLGKPSKSLAISRDSGVQI